MAETTETATASPTGPPPPFWVGLVTWIAVALTALVFLEVVGIFLQASSLKAPGLSYTDKLGYSFLQNLDQAPIGFELLIAALLAVAPVAARQRTSLGQDRGAQVVIIAVVALAFIVMIGGIIGVPARVHILHLQRQKVTSVIQRVLFTFIIRNVGTAALALVAAVGAVRVRFAPRVAQPVTPAP
jgi:hypothetical protein